MGRTTFEEDLVATTIDYINSHPELTEEDINVIWEATTMSVRYYATHSVMTENQLRKKIEKNKSKFSKTWWKKQSKLCVQAIRKKFKECFRNLKISRTKTV